MIRPKLIANFASYLCLILIKNKKGRHINFYKNLIKEDWVNQYFLNANQMLYLTTTFIFFKKFNLTTPGFIHGKGLKLKLK